MNCDSTSAWDYVKNVIDALSNHRENSDLNFKVIYYYTSNRILKYLHSWIHSWIEYVVILYANLLPSVTFLRYVFYFYQCDPFSGKSSALF